MPIVSASGLNFHARQYHRKHSFSSFEESKTISRMCLGLGGILVSQVDRQSHFPGEEIFREAWHTAVSSDGRLRLC